MIDARQAGGPSFFGLAFIMMACSSPTAPSAHPASGAGSPPGTSGAAAALVSLRNAQRTEAGFPALSADSALMHAAQLHAEQMAAAGRMAHVLPEAPFPGPADRLAAAGYAWRGWAENVAFGQQTPAGAVTAWMGSSGHRANMLNATFTELGTGHAVDGAGRAYHVQVFGLPAP